MKAIVYNKKHLPSRLQLEEIEKPKPKGNEVIVKVISASLNAADYRSFMMKMIPKNKIFGSAVAGIIETIGTGVQNYKSGDEIIADLTDCGFGGLAEYVAIPENALVHKPQNTSFDDCAALPVAATTALKAFRDKAQIIAGQRVLIVGSSGGVGSFAVQLAKYYETEITAVCSTKNKDQALALGATEVIDYTIEKLTKNKHKYDLILAINGNYPLLTYHRLLSAKGVLVVVGGSLKQLFKSMIFGWALSLGGKKIRILSAKSDPNDLKFIANLLEQEKIKAVIEKHFTFEKSIEAFKFMWQGHASGKVIIKL